METQPEAICCPRFDPTSWHDRIVPLDQSFIRGRVRTVMHVPLNFGSVMRRLHGKLEAIGAENPQNLCLSLHVSGSRMDVYLATDREVPDAENVNLAGQFYCVTYEGSYSEVGKWTEDFEKRAQGRGLSIKNLYIWYTTCPKCAKKYGENYTVILGEL